MAREIYAYKCRLCDTMHYPFRMVCKNCKQNDFFEFDTVPLPKDGKLLTFTFIYNLPAEFEVPRLGLGIVELENGIRVTGQVDIEDLKELRVPEVPIHQADTVVSRHRYT